MRVAQLFEDFAARNHSTQIVDFTTRRDRSFTAGNRGQVVNHQSGKPLPQYELFTQTNATLAGELFRNDFLLHCVRGDE